MHLPASVSPHGVNLVKAWEGVEDGDPTTVLLDPYVCPAGVVTVGWGHAVTNDDGGQFRVKTHGARRALALARAALVDRYGRPAITMAEAEELLSEDLNDFASQVRSALASAKGETSQAQFDALVSFAFNVGAAGFGQSSLCRFHKRGLRIAADARLEPQALIQISRLGVPPTDLPTAFTSWSRAGGVWLLGLFRRRLSEAMVYRGDEAGEAVAYAQTVKPRRAA